MRRILCTTSIGLLLLLGACEEERPSSSAYVRTSARIEQLAAADAAVRAKAATELASMWPDSARAVPVLAEALDDESQEVRDAAAATIAALARQGLPSLLAFARDVDDSSRRGLLRALGQVRALGAKVTPTDIAGGMQKEPRGGLVFMGLGTGVRSSALPPNKANRFTLAFVGAAADPAWFPRLGVKDAAWADTAAAADAVPLLVTQLEDAEAVWQGCVTKGGAKARPGDLVGLLVEFGYQFDAAVVERLFLADALGAIGPAAKAAVPLLEALVKGADPTLRYLAARSLRSIRGR